MSTQLNNTSTSSVVVPVTNRTSSGPMLDVLSCHNCGARGDCLVERITKVRGQPSCSIRNKKVIQRGKHIFRGGDRADAIYVLREGSVKSYMIMEDGDEQVLDFYLPGDVLGLDGMGADHYLSSCVAQETSTICKMSLSELSEEVLGEGFLRKISDCLKRDQNMMLMLARKDADGRMASFLVDRSQQLEKRGFSPNVFALSMTRQDIANYLGLAVETVCRTLRRLQDSGVLEVSRRKIEIHDFEYLRSIAGTHVWR